MLKIIYKKMSCCFPKKKKDKPIKNTSRNAVCCCFYGKEIELISETKDASTSPDNSYQRFDDEQVEKVLQIREGFEREQKTDDDSRLIKELSDLQDEYNSLKEMLNQNVSVVKKLKQQIAKHKCPVHTECQSNIKCRHKDCKLSHLYQKNKKLQKEVEDLKQEVVSLYEKLNLHKKKVKDKQIVINEKTKELRVLEEKAIGITDTYKDFEKMIEILEKEKEVMKNKIKSCEEIIKDNQNDNAYLSHCNNRYKNQITKKDIYISGLHDKINLFKESKQHGMRQMIDPMD